MRKFALFLSCLIFACSLATALDRQPNADYHARREALAKKTGGVVVLFAPLEATDSEYGFRQDDNFYYLSGVTEPGVALLIAPAVEAKDDSPARLYAEVLFLPPHNLRMEKFTGPKLGAENPDASKVTGFDPADITRTLPVNGHFTARQREIYDIVLGAQEAAMAAFQSGKSMLTGGSDDSLNKVAKEYIKSHGKDLHGQSLDQYFIHGLGHYIGLNVHDPGDYKVPLGPGAAFTIEPGIYIPEENIGVRIEDDYLVDADGKLIKLSAAVPSKAVDVEKAMAGK